MFLEPYPGAPKKITINMKRVPPQPHYSKVPVRARFPKEVEFCK
jgi:hypothetical protein